jgi:hypothetical protein
MDLVKRERTRSLSLVDKLLAGLGDPLGCRLGCGELLLIRPCLDFRCELRLYFEGSLKYR